MRVLFLFFLCLSVVWTQTIDENELFEKSDIITDAPLLTNESFKAFSLTGQIQGEFSYLIPKSRLTNLESSDPNRYLFTIGGDLFLDIRQGKGYKAFVDIAFATSSGGIPFLHRFYDPATDTSTSVTETNTFILQMKEIFIDLPLAHTVYLRLGKQFLKWGTTYFWNPTDLINRERKNLGNLEATREGTWGLKIHIPYKTVANWYTFVDFTDTDTIEHTALASRLEVLLGTTEIGICGWWKKNAIPVYGADLSTRLWGFDIKAEGTISYGDNRPSLKEEIITIGYVPFTNYVAEPISHQWVSRLSFSISRSWDVFDEKERLFTLLEIFHNSQGTNASLFDNPIKLQTALATRAYIPNEYARWYLLFSLGFKKIFVRELSTQMYTLWNIEDESAILQPTLTYAPTSDVTLSAGLSWAIGKPDREYTTTATPLTFSGGVTLRF
ncbi:hypothetical protein [Thermospira aquatica]|uniref:DUF5723 domain-containing protein n=1 Tax=Thermospira aquatica TaxID=2828656 RepID=A0AAX3BCI3_9SPIR|nr:hypothetical protein [Thermospira aquatica]URA09721.1 hypothetical protein KDW03_09560 [Thermospira aquatica]